MLFRSPLGATRALQPTTDVLLSTRSLGEKSQHERNSLEFGLNRRSCVYIQIDVHIMAHQITTFGSTSISRINVEYVARITWKLTHSSPTVFSS